MNFPGGLTLTSVLFSPPAIESSWSKENSCKLLPFEIVDKKRYSDLFTTYVLNELKTEQGSLIQSCCTTLLHKPPKRVFKKFKKPSFGLVMALLDSHTKYACPIIPLSSGDNFFLQKALHFSMTDLLQHRLDKARKKDPSIEFSEEYKAFTNFIENFSSMRQVVLQSQKPHCGVELLADIRKVLSSCNNASVVLKIASEFSHTKTFFTKDTRWVSRHCIFLFINNEQQFFYFYDSDLKAVVRESTLEGLIHLFTEYIRREKPDYLLPHVMWHFSCNPVKQELEDTSSAISQSLVADS